MWRASIRTRNRKSYSAEAVSEEIRLEREKKCDSLEVVQQCEICGQSFRDPGELNGHVKSHLNIHDKKEQQPPEVKEDRS